MFVHRVFTLCNGSGPQIAATTGNLHLKEMLDGCYGVVNNHSWTGPAHDFAYAFSHLGAVAVHGTFFASALVVCKPAPFKSGCGILQQFAACRAQCLVTFFFAAVQSYHLFHYLFFFAYSAHGSFVVAFVACLVLPVVGCIWRQARLLKEKGGRHALVCRPHYVCIVAVTVQFSRLSTVSSWHPPFS